MAATAAQLNDPGAVAADAAGNLFVADTGDNEIRRISPSGTITTVAGNGAQCLDLGPCGDGGPATSAELSGPRGVAVDSAGNVYIADTGDDAIRVFKSGGNITRLAGNGSQCTTSANAEKPTCGDGGPATGASFNSPQGVAIDSAGNVLVADTLDHEVRMFAVGGDITTIAGSGSQCSTAGNAEKPTCGDGGPAATAQLSAPQGVAVDSAHNVYVADTGDQEIREFAAGGMIATVVGSGTSCMTAGGTPKPTCGDGGAATSAQLASPSGVAVDSGGKIEIADTSDAEARQVANATINTIAGTGNVCASTTSSCHDGSATEAQLAAPRGIGVAHGGLVYIGDSGDHKIRLLTPASPPLAAITSPPDASTFTLRHAITLYFACREGAGGPGLQSCRACETRRGTVLPSTCVASGRSFAGRLRLNTSALGSHTYTVTAHSRDGQTGRATLRYTVQRKRPLIYAPPALVKMATRPCVMYRCSAHPGLHTAWEHSLTGQAVTWCANYSCQHQMDLLPVNGFDDNLFPFNPDWAGFVATGAPPNTGTDCGQFPTANPSDWGTLPTDLGAFCTSQQVTTDEGNHGAGYVCNMGRDPSSYFHGHINWEPATYEGRLQWFEHSGQGTDDDYSLDLHTFNLDGVTLGNNGGNAVHIEFDSDETIDHFDDNEAWHSFHLAVDDEDPQTAHYIDGDLAEVTGLVGIDAAHTPAAELHPVYAMAVQLDGNAALAGRNDQWMIFARNWGDEGYCSSHDHPIPAGPITVRIPWLNGARGVDLSAQPRPATGVKNVASSFQAMNIQHPGITERVLPGEGVLLTFDLSTNPSNQPEYWGSIYLKWTFKPHALPVGAGLPAGSPGNRTPSPAANQPGVGDNDVEGLVSALFHRFSRKVRRTLLASIPPLRVITHRPKRVRIVMRPAPIAPLVKPGAFYPATWTDHALLSRDRAEFRTLCRAFHNRLPGFPGACIAAKGR